MSEWISVKDRMPDNDQDVLVYVRLKGRDPVITNSFFMENIHRWSGLHRLNVTHWMPLPEPPKD